MDSYLFFCFIAQFWIRFTFFYIFYVQHLTNYTVYQIQTLNLLSVGQRLRRDCGHWPPNIIGLQRPERNRADILTLLQSTTPVLPLITHIQYSVHCTVQSSLRAGPLVSSLRRSRLISFAANTSKQRSVFISSGMSTVFYSCESWAS